jgi:hypothetical protein
MLRGHAHADFKKILDSDGVDVTLIAPDASEVTARGQVTRIDAQVDPQTGVQVISPKLAVTISLNGLAQEPTTEWDVRTTDVTGAQILRRIADLRFDRTIGFVTMILEDYGG